MYRRLRPPRMIENKCRRGVCVPRGFARHRRLSNAGMRLREVSCHIAQCAPFTIVIHGRRRGGLPLVMLMGEAGSRRRPRY